MQPQHGINWDDDRIGQPIDPIPSSAWIDPIGKFYAVPDCGHWKWAQDQFGDTDLEAKGWVHLSFGAAFYTKVRQSQADTLYDALMVYVAAGYKYADELRKTLDRVLADLT